MRVPQGLSFNSSQVCKSNKAVYGLKQAEKCWLKVLEKPLNDIGFKNSPVYRCIYILDKGTIFKKYISFVICR